MDIVKLPCSGLSYVAWTQNLKIDKTDIGLKYYSPNQTPTTKSKNCSEKCSEN